MRDNCTGFFMHTYTHIYLSTYIMYIIYIFNDSCVFPKGEMKKCHFYDSPR